MTRELIQAMLDGRTLTDRLHFAWYDPTLPEPFRFASNATSDSEALRYGWWMYDWTIKPEPKRRPMTRYEMLAWACSEEAHGWVVRYGTEVWYPPSHYEYGGVMETYERARITPDGPGPAEPFEVDET